MPVTRDPEELRGTVRCVLADPPWAYDNKTIRGGAQNHYPTLSLRDLESYKDLIDGLVDPAGSHLWLWTTNSMLVGGEALDIVRHWGFSPKQLITWVKGSIECRFGCDPTSGIPRDWQDKKDESRRPKPNMVIGPPVGVVPGLRVEIGLGHYTRGATEHIIFATRGKRIKAKNDGAVPNVIVAPTGGHSAKPIEQYDTIEMVSTGPYYEMFARGKIHPGWDGFGDELEV